MQTPTPSPRQTTAMPPMVYRELGRTGLRTSIVGMGTGGGGDPLGQSSGRSEADIIRFLQHAFDLGINLFDTAPGYLDSEVLLGRAVKSMPRDQVIVSTKIPLAGAMPGKAIRVMAPDEIETALNTSLRRLQLDHVDLLLMGVAGPEHRERVLHEQLPILDRLRAQGKFRFLGSTELSREDGAHAWLADFLPTGKLDVAMVAHNAINQSAQSVVFPLCRTMNIGVLNVFTVRKVFSNPTRLREVLADLAKRGVIEATPDQLADPVTWMMADTGAASLMEAAYRFAAYTPGVTAVMNGSIDAAHTEENVRSILKGPLPDGCVARWRRIFGRVAEAIGN